MFYSYFIGTNGPFSMPWNRSGLGFGYSFTCDKLFNLPPLRYQAQLRLHHLHLLMSGKAEFDKPFSVDCTRHLLKDFDAAGVVLDQVVVDTEDCGDFALGWERRYRDWYFRRSGLPRIPRNSCSGCDSRNQSVYAPWGESK